MLLDSSGHIKLTDFGLAVDQRSNHSPNDVAGTAGYMAPEVLLKMPLTRSADVWSLGVTLYKLVTGHRPFKTPREVIEGGLSFRRGPASRLSPSLQSLLSDLLHKDPAARLGCGPDEWGEVKRHHFFEGIEWDTLHLSRAPRLPREGCILPSVEPEEKQHNGPDRLTNKDQLSFCGWDFNTLKTSSNAGIWDPEWDPEGVRHAQQQQLAYPGAVLEDDNNNAMEVGVTELPGPASQLAKLSLADIWSPPSDKGSMWSPTAVYFCDGSMGPGINNGTPSSTTSPTGSLDPGANASVSVEPRVVVGRTGFSLEPALATRSSESENLSSATSSPHNLLNADGTRPAQGIVSAHLQKQQNMLQSKDGTRPAKGERQTDLQLSYR